MGVISYVVIGRLTAGSEILGDAIDCEHDPHMKNTTTYRIIKKSTKQRLTIVRPTCVVCIVRSSLRKGVVVVFPTECGRRMDGMSSTENCTP